MDRVKFVTRKGVQILIVDASHSADLEQSIALLCEAKKIVSSQPLNSVLLLMDVTGARFNIRGVDEVKSYARSNTSHLKASAVVGITLFTKVVLEAIRTHTGRPIRSFDTQGEALDWLASQ